MSRNEEKSLKKPYMGGKRETSPGTQNGMGSEEI
jgi:hypothetical protein